MILGTSIFIIGTIFLIIGFIFTLKSKNADYLYVCMYDVFLLALIYKFILKNYLNEYTSTTKAILFIAFFTLMVFLGFYWTYKKERSKNGEKN